MKYFVILVIILFILVSPVYAQRGCCSHHGGVSSSCTSDCRQICNDGTISPSCMCGACNNSSSNTNGKSKRFNYSTNEWEYYNDDKVSNNNYNNKNVDSNTNKEKSKYNPSILEIIATILMGGLFTWYILGIISESIDLFKRK